MFRVDGALVPLKNGERLMPDALQKMALGIMNPVQKQRFEETREVDLAYGIPGLGRFRVNVFQQRGTVGIVFRVIPFGVKSIDQLHAAQGDRDDRDGAPRARSSSPARPARASRPRSRR